MENFLQSVIQQTFPAREVWIPCDWKRGNEISVTDYSPWQIWMSVLPKTTTLTTNSKY